MSSTGAERRDFFISFNQADRNWAEWIATELEAAGYTTYFQTWDFRPGSNFVLEMQKAAEQSERTIAVLSPNYLKALFTQPEWAAALVQDPTGIRRTLVPIRVQECKPSGLLSAIVYCDLVGLNEDAARVKLLAAAKSERAKPNSAEFPTATPTAVKPPPQLKRSYPSAKPIAGSTPKQTPPDTSSIWFIAALAVAATLIGFAAAFVPYELKNQLYYLALVALGLAAAGSLFRTGRAKAFYRGETKWGVVELGGPVAAFALVLGAGWLFAPTPQALGLTIYVRAEDGSIPLKGQGLITLDLGASPRVEAIGDNGAAFFLGIPADYRGRSVPVTLEADGFERIGNSPIEIAGDSVEIKVRRRAKRLYGTIIDEHQRPIAGATIDVVGFQENTDNNGRFDLAIPATQVLLRVTAKGFKVYTENVTPGANEMTIQLEPERQ